jgi:hypothetical protein
MSNQRLKIGLVALMLSTIMVFAAVLPAANALTPSTVTNARGHKTDSSPGGQHVCGNKLCSTDEWMKMKKSLHAAQSNPDKCKELKEWMYCGEPIVVSKTSK